MKNLCIEIILCFLFGSGMKQCIHYSPTYFQLLVAWRIQLWQLLCATLASRNAQISQSKDGNYLTKNDGFIGLKECCIVDLPEKDCLLRTFPDLSKISKAQQFDHRGSKWHECVIFKEGTSFARVQGVYVIGDVFFTYNCLKTEYALIFNAYEIIRCEQEYDLISFAEL